MAEEDQHFLEDTAQENSANFFECVQDTGDAEGFLHRTSHISTRGCKMSSLEQDVYLDVNYDTDGIVLELASLNSVKFQTRHLYCLPHGIGSLKCVYSVLKKHLCLSEYNRGNTLSILRRCRGVQLFYENTWECYVALIPVRNRSLGEMDEKFIVTITFEFLKRLYDIFKKKMYLASAGGKIANTLKKNSLATMSKLHIAPDEQSEVFQIMDDAMRTVGVPNGFVLYVYAFKFGERKTGIYDMRSVFDMSLIRSQTIHVAATFSLYQDLGILWSRDGIQKIVGRRGCLLSALSFKEASNFQSNLDGRPLDLSLVVRDLVPIGNEIRFVQFYSDVAHNNPSTLLHPVSGSIVTAGMIHGNSRKKLEQDALKYIQVCRDNFLLQGSDLKCRLEFVLAPKNPREVFEPSDFFVQENVWDLFSREALIIPFKMKRGLLMKVIQQIGLYLVSQLGECFKSAKGTGHFMASWTAFQSECAIEKLLWGKTFSFKSDVHSVNLGPGSGTPSRSLTDFLGFLALEEPTTSTVEESPPPLNIWCKSDKICHSIKILFGLADHVRSSYPVLGTKLLLILLQDLHFRRRSLLNFGEFLSTLKALESISRPNVREKVSVGYLSFNLSKSKGLNCAFGRALEIISYKEEGIDLAEVLSCGISEMKLRVFPKIKMYDSSRHRNVAWNGLDVWQIHVPRDDTAEDGTSTRAITCDVINEMERHGLVHASKFKTFEILEFPWIRPLLRKLKGCKLSQEQIQTITLFISSVALLQQGWYVDFKSLVRLEGRLPLSQHRLRELEIQSKYLLGPFRTPRIWRIHDSISVKINLKEKRQESVPQNKTHEKESDDESEREELNLTQTEKCEENNEVSNEVSGVVLSPTSHIPAGSKMRWTPDELEILNEIKENKSVKSLRDRYKLYKKMCHERRVPDRPLHAFKKKFLKM